ALNPSSINFELKLYFLVPSSKCKTSRFRKLAKYFCKLLLDTPVTLDNSVKVTPSGYSLNLSKIKNARSTDCIPLVLKSFCTICSSTKPYRFKVLHTILTYCIKD